MEKFDSLKPEDQVTVTIWGPDDSRLYDSTHTGYHSIEEAIKEAIANAGLEINPEDCVFEVSNLTTSVSHKYRLNAHGHLVLMPTEI